MFTLQYPIKALTLTTLASIPIKCSGFLINKVLQVYSFSDTNTSLYKKYHLLSTTNLI